MSQPVSAFPSRPPTPPNTATSSSPPSSPPATPSVPSGSSSVPAGPAVRGSGPSSAELLDFVRRAAADPELIASLPLDPDGRTWVRLAGPGESEAWLIGWPPGSGTGWHDHAESLGAFATATGELVEHSLAVRLPAGGWKTLELAEDFDRERRLAAGQGRAFGRHHVHEVLNASAAHAVSVHAYYPPLPLIRRFSRTGAVLRLEQVERPEDWQ
ncbi:cysteine dioxygenase [Streptomyces sp. NPDC020875]|uniref:cysteine dioxygenase n=1 Tax=Streptomyces sp. NPDC020875 TaxID=3154898 RepID=UPI0033E0C9A8